jgi:Phospholipid-translocating ATPase N-terminal
MRSCAAAAGMVMSTTCLMGLSCCTLSRRYNVVTFVPRFLFEQFSQVAYFYFLVQVGTVLLPFDLLEHN